MLTARYALSPYITQTRFFLTGLKQFLITRSLPLESDRQIKDIPIFISELNTNNTICVILCYRHAIARPHARIACHAPQTDIHGRFRETYRSHLQESQIQGA